MLSGEGSAACFQINQVTRCLIQHWAKKQLCVWNVTPQLQTKEMPLADVQVQSTESLLFIIFFNILCLNDVKALNGVELFVTGTDPVSQVPSCKLKQERCD